MARKWTKERLEILKAYLQGGLSSFDIAQKMKTTIDTIDGAIRRYGLQKFRKVDETPILDLEDLNDKNFDELKKAAKLQWVVPKTKVPENPKNKFKTYIIVGDIHLPKHNEVAIKSVLKLMDDVRFDGIINIGDFMDLACISHHNKGKNKTLEGQRLKSDYIVGNALLDEFDVRLPQGAEKYFLKGNHEVWADSLIEELPVLEGLFDVETCLKLKERGYKVYPYNDIISFGRLKVTHGIYTGSNPAKLHANRTLSNIIVGHLHSPEMALIHSPAKEVSVVGYVNGCLCDMAPDYMKNKPSNWAHGFAVLYVFPDGYFDIDLKRIVKGKFVFNQKVYDGNK